MHPLILQRPLYQLIPAVVDTVNDLDAKGLAKLHNAVWKLKKDEVESLVVDCHGGWCIAGWG